MALPKSVISVGMTAIISVINLLIPSASSKAAMLIPIIRPVSEMLSLDPNLAVQSFQYGDGFTNLICPFSGTLVGSCVLANVPMPTWMKWAVPKIVLLLVISFGVMILLTESGWTAF